MCEPLHTRYTWSPTTQHTLPHGKIYFHTTIDILPMLSICAPDGFGKERSVKLACQHCQNHVQRPHGVDQASPPFGSRGRDPWRLRSTRLHWQIDPRQSQGFVRLREREPWIQTSMKSGGYSAVSEIPAKTAAFPTLAISRTQYTSLTTACRLRAGAKPFSPFFPMPP
jgi:hypothetical protein